MQASINIDVDTLAEDVTPDGRFIRQEDLRRITFEKVLPRLLELLREEGIRATFFVIGKDVADQVKMIAEIAREEHEISNHSMHHPKQFALLPEEEIEAEIQNCEETILKYCGIRPVGFRAPGYTITPRVIEVLRRRNYRYDSSLNRSKMYYGLKHLYKFLRLEDKDYLSVQDYRSLDLPSRPFRIGGKEHLRVDKDSSLWEIPIPLVPGFSYPFVTSMMLSFGIRPSLWALRRISGRKEPLNLELHINEFTDRADIRGTGVRFFLTEKYTRISLAGRMAYFRSLFREIKARYEICLLKDLSS